MESAKVTRTGTRRGPGAACVVAVAVRAPDVASIRVESPSTFSTRENCAAANAGLTVTESPGRTSAAPYSVGCAPAIASTAVARTATRRCEPSGNVTTTGTSAPSPAFAPFGAATVSAPVVGSTLLGHGEPEYSAASAKVVPAGAPVTWAVTASAPTGTATDGHRTSAWRACESVVTVALSWVADPSGNAARTPRVYEVSAGASSGSFAVITPVDGSTSSCTGVAPAAAKATPSGTAPRGAMVMVPSAAA